MRQQPFDPEYLDYYLEPDTDTYTVLGFRSDADIPETLTVPATYNGKAVTAVGMAAFEGLPLRSVTLPAGCLIVCGMAFAVCRDLTEVHLPATLTCIEPMAFFGCESLQTVTVPATADIGFAAFPDTCTVHMG